ncbi:IS3 family transposase [Egibacter rhizosphaerae]|uniref:IS3 family transposase n=1 Tax=Egibacter rhizosphaerae TaxID=1670831 RepID=UPI0013F179F7
MPGLRGQGPVARPSGSARPRRGGVRPADDVELATLEYINWFNHKRIHTAIGRPPAEHAAAYWNAHNDLHHTPAIQ